MSVEEKVDFILKYLRIEKCCDDYLKTTEKIQCSLCEVIICKECTRYCHKCSYYTCEKCAVFDEWDGSRCKEH